ncbi:MAG TPA: DNA replication/repair protein RecF [Candidatus Rothia avistercoris]|uniref:DNA replication and repair protein RecF n=1 Tax=Candidatus Rothia avistercoris TaxID=2840479 RepID=A0A9D2UFZ9_9MICC|nr:DNA replication/repair protein RecF [Candidatus Rothia avistercoris]
MYIDHLSLMDYRTYQLLILPLTPGVTVFLGSNGVGKTNIVEAIDYTAQLASHRVSQDAPLVRVGADRAYIRTRTVRGNQQTVLEFELAPGKSNRVRINRAAPVRAREALGVTRTVLFSPEDLQLVKGDPAGRRRFLDDLAVSLRPSVAAYRADYERVLRQRNSLLKSIRSRRSTGAEDTYTLEVWNKQLADAGVHLLQARLRTLALLLPQLQRAYTQLTDGSKSVSLVYDSTVFPPISANLLPTAALMGVEDLREAMLRGFADKQREELERGVTLVGPHRDDLALELGGIPVKGFASHGESWSYALALKLASWYVHLADNDALGASPILILDDVFAELDTARRHKLGAIVAGAEQVLVTCAVASDIPEELGDITLVRVEPGRAWVDPSPLGNIPDKE